MGDAASMEGSSLAKIFVGGLDRSVDEVRTSEKIRISLFRALHQNFFFSKLALLCEFIRLNARKLCQQELRSFLS